jgi:heme oxygenase
MLQRLSTDTRAHHANADADRLAAMDVASRVEYRTFLARVYGFESAVEDAISKALALDPDVLDGRSKMDCLRQDLEALGLARSEIARLPVAATPKLRSHAQALGWLFVLERHTLVAGVLRRHLQRTITDADAFNYFSAYGDTTGARFRSLGEWLARVAQVCASGALATAAGEAFRAQRQWYRSTRSASVSQTSTPGRAESADGRRDGRERPSYLQDAL